MANSLHIEIVDSPSKAPHYRRDSIDIRALDIKKVIVVGKGTVSGKPTVDFQLVATDGSEFVAMLTGELVKQLAHVIAGVEARG
jgi:hypothetical protein